MLLYRLNQNILFHLCTAFCKLHQTILFPQHFSAGKKTFNCKYVVNTSRILELSFLPKSLLYIYIIGEAPTFGRLDGLFYIVLLIPVIIWTIRNISNKYWQIFIHSWIYSDAIRIRQWLYFYCCLWILSLWVMDGLMFYFFISCQNLQGWLCEIGKT